MSSSSKRAFDSFATSVPKMEKLPITVTQSPSTTGTGIIAFEYDGGVIMAADTLGSYGSLARYRSIPRLLKVNDKVVVGCMGDYADYQYLQQIIEQMEIDEACQDDGLQTTARSLHSWLTRVLYNRRCKMDPLWTTFVVAGTEEDGKPFLGYVDKIGTAYNDSIICTGYASVLATPLIRKAVQDGGGKLSLEQARKLVVDSLTLVYYRDAHAFNKYHVAVIPNTGEAATVEDAATLKGNWELANMIAGYE